MIDIIPLLLILLLFPLTLFFNKKESRGNHYMIVLLTLFIIFFICYGIISKVNLYQSLLFAVIALGFLIKQIRYRINTSKNIS